MISFYKERDEMVLPLADDSMDEMSISNYSSEHLFDEDDDEEIGDVM